MPFKIRWIVVFEKEIVFFFIVPNFQNNIINNINYKLNYDLTSYDEFKNVLIIVYDKISRLKYYT